MAIDEPTDRGAPRRRALRWAVAVLALAVVGLLLWAAVAGVLGLRQVASAQRHAAQLQSELADGDASGAAASLRSLERDSAGIDRWLGGAPWSWGTWLPALGDTLAATTTLASSVHEVAGPLAPAAAAVLDVRSSDLADVAAAVSQESGAFAAAGAAAAAAAPRVAAIDPAAIPGPLAARIAEGRREVADALPAATGIAAASVLLPGLLGIEGPSEWLLVASQPAEARGSGAGFFGAYGVMRGDGGSLGLVEARPNDDLFDRPVDLSVLPPQFAQLWGPAAAYIRGHNLTRHFPYAAQLLAQSAAGLGADADYIVALDPRVVAGLLEVTGPVTAAGVTIDAGDAEQYLTSGIYRQFPEPGLKDQVALQLMSAVLQQLQSTDLELGRLAAALAEPLQQQRLVAWAADPAQEEILALSSLGGALPAAPLTLTAAINNAGGNKLDAYLRSDVRVDLAGRCGGSANGTVSVTLTMADVPPGLPGYVVDGIRGPQAYGGNRAMVHVYGPPGVFLDSFTVDGRTALVGTGVELGRPVWGTELDLLPGQSRTVAAAFHGDLPDEPLRFLPQPMIQDTAVTLRDTRGC